MQIRYLHYWWNYRKKNKTILIERTDGPSDTNKKDELPKWAIALFVLGSLIVGPPITMIIYKSVVSKVGVKAELDGSLEPREWKWIKWGAISLIKFI